MDSNFTTLDSNQTLTRHTDVQAKPAAPSTQGAPALPAVNWAAIGQSAPLPLPIGQRKPEDPLPFADVVILTWTSAEWCALDHVFLNNAAPGYSNDYTWKQAWLPYSRGASQYYADPKSGALWGSFQLVQIADQSKRPWRVLLFKSNAHLAHSPWDAGLTAMLGCILADTQTDRIYTIGTAGGARLDQRLGDSVITNAALLDLQRPQNTTDPENGNMYRCPHLVPGDSAARPGRAQPVVPNGSGRNIRIPGKSA